MVLVLRKAPWSRTQLVGAVFLLVVVLAHLFEACEWLPWMHWGMPDSPGHYLDLTSVVLGMILFPAGYALHLVTTKGLAIARAKYQDRGSSINENVKIVRLNSGRLLP